MKKMSDHYYSPSPNARHEFEEWSFELKGKTFHFLTDSGVFSRKTVDYGSRVLIEAFDWTQLPEGPILDVGCGYGAIGLAIASSSKRHLEMVDVNERAIDLAKKNAEKNQVSTVDIHLSNVYEAVHQNTYAAIVSNPPVR